MRRLLLGVLLVVLTSCGGEDAGPPTSDQSPVTHDSIAAKLADSVVKDADQPVVPDTSTYTVTDSTIQIKSTSFPKPTGRVVNVLVTGIDARLGEKTGRADANHILRFFLDSGCIEIISIPRGTYANAGFDDTTNQNIIANVRTARGQRSYMREVARIAGVPSVDYWVEFGFSQAIGLLELMGYKDNAQTTLRVLRSRKAFASGDFQRSYNQGQFIRQAVLRVFDNTDDVLGQLAMRAALGLVETNMSYDVSQWLLNEIRAKGFASSTGDRIWVRMRPSSVSRFQVFSFDSANVKNLDSHISKKVDRLIPDSAAKRSADYERRFERMVVRAAQDSSASPRRVISSLKTPYERRSWMQINDKQKRNNLKNRLCLLLLSAYQRTNQPAEAQQILQFLELDNKVSAGR